MRIKRGLPYHYNQLIHWIERDTRPLDAKLIIVPTQQIGYEITTAMAALSKGWLNLEALPLSTVASRVVEKHGDGPMPVVLGATALPFLFESLLEDVQVENGMPLNRAAGSFARTVSDLRMAGVSPDEYLHASGGPFTTIVHAVFDRYLEKISSLGILDEAGLYVRATEILCESGFTIDSIAILDEVNLPEMAASFVRALGDGAKSKYRIGAATPHSPLSAGARMREWPVPGNAASETAASGYAAAGTDKAGHAASETAAAGHATTIRARVHSAVDPENEIRAVFRMILEKGLELDRVEIACTTSDPYVRITRHMSVRYNIPLTVATGFRAMDSRAGTLARSYLQWIRDGKHCLDLVRILRSGLIRFGGNKPMSTLDVGRMANLLATMPVSGHPDRYRSALDRIRSEIENRVELTRGTFLEKEERARLRICDNIEDQILALMELADKISGTSSPADMRSMMSSLLYTYAPIGDDPEDDEGNMNPEFVARQELITRFDGLARQLDIRLPESTLITRTLEVISGAVVYARSARSGKLHLGPLSSAGYTGRPHLFVVGLDDQRGRPGLAEDPLFSDQEKDQIASGEQARLIPASYHRTGAERNLLRQAISRFDGQVHLIYSTYDLAEGRETGPSAALMSVSGLDEGMKKRITPHSFVPHGVSPTIMDDTDALLVMAAAGNREGSVQDFARALYPGLAAGLEARKLRTSEEWTAFDGIVGSSGRARDLFSGKSRLSSSRLETLTTCPYRYFLKYVLRLRVSDEPDPDVWMDALTRGAITHDVFQEFMQNSVEEDRSLEIGQIEENATLIQQLFLRAVDKHEQLSDAPNPAAREAVLADFELMGRAFLCDEARRTSYSTPEAFEFGFGVPPYGKRSVDDPTEPFRLKLHGLEFNFTGWIDRIDRLNDGGFAITDYKTGSGRSFRADDLLDGGKKLQWALYAYVIEQLRGECVETSGYLFPGKQDLGRRIEADPNLVRGEIVTLLRNAGLMVNGGFFLPAADPQKACKYCDYKRICGDTKQRKTEVIQKIKASTPGDILHETLTSWPYATGSITL